MKSLNPILISGKEVLPLVEGGKGINGSDGRSSGAWAHENCVGTFSGVSPDFYDDKGNVVIEKFLKRSRPERHEEMVERAIKGGIAQAQVAHEVSGGNGRIHMNMLWELADSQRILEGVLEKAKGLINGITCGAGMPYHLGALLLPDRFFRPRLQHPVETRLFQFYRISGRRRLRRPVAGRRTQRPFQRRGSGQTGNAL